MSKAKFNNICKRVTDVIIKQLEKGIVPWHKPWAGNSANIPRSLSSKKPYRGANVMILGSAGYPSPWWLTFGQARKLGAKVRKGERSLPVHYWKFWGDQVKCWYCKGEKSKCFACDGTGKLDKMPSLFSFNVFNAMQVEGLDDKYYEVKEDKKAKEFNPIEEAEKICSGYKNSPEVIHDQGNRNYYIPSSDQIHLCKPEQFDTPENYYCTRFHESMHSTGHGKRLSRKGVTDPISFGSHKYSAEEMVAEMGATFLCGISGIDRKEILENSSAYIGSWMKKLKENQDWIVWAGSRASKGCDHILGTEYTKEVK